MEKWSLISTFINYIQYKRYHVDYFKLDVKALEAKNYKRIYDGLEEDR